MRGVGVGVNDPEQATNIAVNQTKPVRCLIFLKVMFLRVSIVLCYRLIHLSEFTSSFNFLFRTTCFPPNNRGLYVTLSLDRFAPGTVITIVLLNGQEFQREIHGITVAFSSLSAYCWKWLPITRYLKFAPWDLAGLSESRIQKTGC